MLVRCRVTFGIEVEWVKFESDQTFARLPYHFKEEEEEEEEEEDICQTNVRQNSTLFKSDFKGCC